MTPSIFTSPEYEEELWAREEKEPQDGFLDAVRRQPADGIHTGDVSEDLPSEQQEPEPGHIKKEEPDPTYINEIDESKPPDVKEEEQEVDITNFPLTVIVKSEDDDDDEEGDGDQRGGSQEDGLLAPLSDSDDVMSQTLDTEDDDDDDDDDDEHSKVWFDAATKKGQTPDCCGQSKLLKGSSVTPCPPSRACTLPELRRERAKSSRTLCIPVTGSSGSCPQTQSADIWTVSPDREFTKNGSAGRVLVSFGVLSDK
ncbi:uncharacterized protein LOC133418212 isoform X3 [Phycodurus eques]|uniref:uncharacterized protein LOC133418212 isoform X3 n=1 Tax=Phycodurus eques TaxID=693459 RepID=UPI002ACE86C9|nr:uncharacterized protein LOC133418212 isoform X3 [Phycodurus eques]